MPRLPRITRSRATALVMTGAVQALSLAPPACGNSVPIGIFARPIVPPPYALPSDVDANGEGLAPDRISVAAGAAITSDYDGSDHYSLAPVAGATARLHGHLVAWHGNSLGVDLVPEYRKQRFKFIFAPYLDLNTDRTARPRDPIMKLLPRRKLALEGGAAIGFSQTGAWLSPSDRLTVQVAATHDLGTVSRSYLVSPSVTYMVPLSKAVLVSASGSFDVVGAGYARTYFGIDHAASVASGLPTYAPGGGIKSASFGLDGLVSLRGDLRRGFAVGGLINYERLLGDFAGSPIVAMRGNPNQFSAALGLAYTF